MDRSACGSDLLVRRQSCPSERDGSLAFSAGERRSLADHSPQGRAKAVSAYAVTE
jgi:hypothetical protein